MPETKPYRVRVGRTLNHNTEIKRGGDVVELTDQQALDREVVGNIEPLPPTPPAPVQSSSKQTAPTAQKE